MATFLNSGALRRASGGAAIPAESATTAPTPSAINLRRLVVLRAIALGGQALAVWASVAWLDIALPWQRLAGILAAAAAVNLLTGLRLRRPWPVRDVELFAHFTFDVLALTAVLYFAGGSTNPFAPFYLLPLTLAAAALPWIYTWAMAALTIACYSALLFWYVPIAGRHAGHVNDFELHVLGMWIGFLLSAALIAYFAVRMRETLRERERLRAEMREQELRHERLLALGTLAAGAAHELGTPLSTMAVLANDLMRDGAGSPEKLKTLRAQIARCKEILASLSVAAGQTRAEGGGVQALDAYLASLVERWRSVRPQVRTRVGLDGVRPAPRILTERTLEQALLNILNNAADASAQDVEVEARWTDAELTFEVRDRGPGLSVDAQEHAGEPFFSTKTPGEGMGLGLFLARGTLERLGGSLRLANRADGGALCRAWLPLAALRVGDS
ncbi:MAG: ATP-binding protein [Sulfurifustaceae bacterium]